MDLNKVMLIGRVTQQPEVRTLQGGQTVATFSIATNRQWTDKNGQKQERAEFHNIVAWRKLAEIIQQYVSKGRQVYIEGSLQTRSWDDPQGQKKYRTEIIADNLIMLGSKSDGGSAPYAAPAPSAPTGNYDNNNNVPQPSVQDPAEEISVEDIPF